MSSTLTALATENDGTTLFRCADCGKWSHAARKPKIHLRFVQEQYDEPEPADDVIVSYEHGHYSDYSGEESSSGWWIKCGPFDTYHAFKVDS